MSNPKSKQRSKREAYIEAQDLLEQRQINSSKKSRFSRADLEKSGIYLKTRQLELYKGIRNNTLTICQGPAGTSKAQPLSSPILTPNGWTTMGEVEVGDRVISVDGNSCVVTGTFHQGEKDIWELTFSDGSKVECCSDHLWFTQTDKDRNYRRWTKKVDGKRTRFSAEREGSVKSTIEIVESLYTNRGRINHTIPIVLPVKFKEQKIEIDAYLMGCLLGDGCFRSHVGFTSADEEIIKNIENELENEDISISYRSQYDYALIKEPTHKTNNFKQYLIKLGLWGKLSDSKFIPNEYKFNTVENRIKLLNGLMDTDGTVSKDGTHVSFSSTSFKLIQDVKEIVQSLGGISTDHTPHNEYYTYKGVKMQGKTSYRITITMNPNINPFSLKRKFDLVVPKSKYKPNRYIVSAKMIGKKEAKCIKIDHPTHLYVTNDYIVTHNTFTACYTALSLLADQKIERIVLTKPIQESGESLGFLPGNLLDKVDPYMKSYFSNFEKIIGKSQLEWLKVTGEIVVEPLAYMRGTTYDNCIMLLDEAQNSTMTQLILWVTRLGENSKAIMMGDISQYDIRRQDSRFMDFINLYSNDEDVFNFQFKSEDIVRNKFLISIVDKYEKWKVENEKIVQNEQNRRR